MSFKEISDKETINKLNSLYTLKQTIQAEIKEKELILESICISALSMVKELDNPFPDGIFDYLEDYGCSSDDYTYSIDSKNIDEEELEEARKNYETLNDIIEKHIIKPEENPWAKYDKENLVNEYNSIYYSSYTSSLIVHEISFSINDIPFKLKVPERYRVDVDDFETMIDGDYYFCRYGISAPIITDGMNVINKLDTYSYDLDQISSEVIRYLKTQCNTMVYSDNVTKATL